MPTNKKKTFFGRHGGRLLAILIGALLVAVGLELFLIPNRVIDGGIVGVSIILDALTPIPLGVYLVLLNLPFLVVGYKQIGKTFALSTLFAVSALAVFVTLLRRLEPVTTDVILATVFGGIILGIGVGLIIRFGGSLDGTEIVAILVNRKFGFSVGEIIMFFNVFILGSAGFVFTWESAMYSLIAYFIAFKTIDVVIEGLDESKSVIIISDESQKISETILARLGRGVTHIYGKGGYTQEEKELLYCIVTRLELAKLKSIVQEIDPNALIAVENVHDVMGGQFKKRPITDASWASATAASLLGRPFFDRV
nr:YitT family protein [Calditerricola satsumensis]